MCDLLFSHLGWATLPEFRALLFLPKAFEDGFARNPGQLFLAIGTCIGGSRFTAKFPFCSPFYVFGRMDLGCSVARHWMYLGWQSASCEVCQRIRDPIYA